MVRSVIVASSNRGACYEIYRILSEPRDQRHPNLRACRGFVHRKKEMKSKVLDDSEFAKLQYSSLREQINETKNRISKTIGFGLTIVPAAQFLSQEIGIVALSLPILVWVVAVVYLAENTALMRCGRYIREEIEKNLDKVVGWEHWLEQDHDWGARKSNKYQAISFYLLFSVHLLVSIYLAISYVFEEVGEIFAAISFAFYFGISVWFVYYLAKNLPLSTK